MMRSDAISVFMGMLPAMKTTDPYLADRAGERHPEPDEPGRIQVGKDHAEDDLHAVRAEARGHFFELDVEIGNHRLQRADHERQPDEDERDRNPQGTEDGLYPVWREILPKPPVGRIQTGQRDACHGGRQGERQVNHRIDDAAARKVVAHEHPRDDDPEHAVDARRDERGADRQPIGRDHARVADGRPEKVPAVAERPHGQREQGHEDDHRQIQHGERHRDPEAGQTRASRRTDRQ